MAFIFGKKEQHFGRNSRFVRLGGRAAVRDPAEWHRSFRGIALIPAANVSAASGLKGEIC